MSRRDYEGPVLDSFTRFLNKTSGRLWTASSDEVLNPSNGKSYDCEFTSNGSRPIAVDVFRLFPRGSDQKIQSDRHKLIDKLAAELQSRGLGGLRIETPLPDKRNKRPQWYAEIGAQFQDAVAHDPNAERYEIDGVIARRYGGAAEPIFFAHHWMSGHQPIEAGGSPLAAILRDKKDQIDVADHDRFLIGTMRGMPVGHEYVTAACAFIDFTPFLTVDRIYLESGDDEFRLIYNRQAWEAMERGELPSEHSERSLVVDWIEARMACHWPSGLDVALRISWTQGSRDWLSPGGREFLKLESRLLLQNCGWATPLRYLSVHQGPVPVELDMRRPMKPIQ
jgi:hypothetical protein